MRPLRALLHAMRRRTDRIGPDGAERLISGDHQGPLRHLLDAARAPATDQELAGEKAVVAAFTTHRRRAARTARKQRLSSARATVVTATVGLALLAFGGTALAARTGNLPQEAQQHAHRLFSALGVPAPRTGPVAPPHPAATSPAPTTRPSPSVAALTWCDSWRGGAGRTPLTRENKRKLSAAAGGEGRIDRYCTEIRRSAAPTPSVSGPVPARPPVAPSGTPQPIPPPGGSAGPGVPGGPGGPGPSGSGPGLDPSDPAATAAGGTTKPRSGAGQGRHLPEGRSRSAPAG